MTDFHPVLAEFAYRRDVFEVFIWFGAAGLLTLVGFYVVAAVRRWALRRHAVATFTLQDLRDLRMRGELNEREFATLRAQLLDQMGATADGPSAPDEPNADCTGDGDP